MKINLLLSGLLVILFSCPSVAQKNQSALYDAIELYNAKKNITYLPVIEGTRTYNLINPLNGQKVKEKVIDTQLEAAIASQDPIAPNDIILAILRRNAGLDENADIAQIKNAYKDNPFLKDILTTSDNSVLRTNDFSINTTVSGQSGGFAGNLVSNVANGVADFLIQRAQEEINIAVFQRLQNILSKYPEFNVLFSSTYKLLGPIEAYNYATTLKALKDAVHNDIIELPSRIPQLYELPKYKVLTEQIPELTSVFALSDLLGSLNNNQSTSQIISAICSKGYVTEPKNNYASLIQLLGKFSNGSRKQLLGQPDDGAFEYFSIKDIDFYSQGDLTARIGISKIFLGLLYQNAQHISFYHGANAFSVKDMLSPYVDRADKFTDKLMLAATAMKSADSLLKEIVKDEYNVRFYNNNKDLNRLKQYSVLAKSWMQMAAPFITVESGGTSIPALQSFKIVFTDINQFYLPSTEKVIDLINQVEQKQYNLAIYQFADLLRDINNYIAIKMQAKGYEASLQGSFDIAEENIEGDLKHLIDEHKDEINAMTSALNSASDTDIKQNLTNRIVFVTSELKTLENQKKLVEKQKPSSSKLLSQLPVVIEYTNMLASIGEAENAEQIKEILNSTALPAGSSRIKKKTYFNLAVNGYVGWFGGRTSNDSGEGFTNVYGITAPVGLTLSTGFGTAGSLSLFTGAIDVGSVLRYKLNEQGKYQQNVSIGNIFSPSMQLIYGLPFYLPFSIGGGIQWTTPAEIASEKISLNPQFNLFIGVDIPFYNLASIKKIKYGGYGN
jgi:hypothetical protein